mgnify:CR=1 FL=1
MRDALAERLLAQVMGWTPEDVANERPLLQAMAALKYDEYQQYAPGMRFVESLALWLRQFARQDERKVAYQFVKSRLLFLSAAELSHLVSVAYPDHIRPLLVHRAAAVLGADESYVGRITASPEYRALRRQSLFLGLSDGARVDTFRRATSDELSHEQIWQTYEMSYDKAMGVLAELRRDLATVPGLVGDAANAFFRMIFLLDDFSGSGRTCIRNTESENRLVGKLARFKEQIVKKDAGLHALVSAADLYIGVVLYVATSRAKRHIEGLLPTLFEDLSDVTASVGVVYSLDDHVAVTTDTDKAFMELIDSYYDPCAADEHTRKGGTADVKCGFSQCALPLVLSHNTPNNSVFLLWANPERHSVRGLFPRISRHRSDA